MNIIGKSVIRKEAFDKVTGRAMYTADEQSVHTLHVKMKTSPYGHAKIVSIDDTLAKNIPGVKAIILGSRDFPLTGEEIRDRPPIAVEKVRYYGEPVALVVADRPEIAKKAAELIDIKYELLPVINNPSEALKEDSPIIHPNLADYEIIGTAYPTPNSNISNTTKIRKGNMNLGWRQSEVIVEGTYKFSPSSHAAMETRSATAEIKPDGYVYITTSSQAPFMVKKLLSIYFNIEVGKIVVETPLVGGGYGGKAPVQWEILAYLASLAVGGRRVQLTYTRKEDLTTAPCHVGLEAKVKIGSTKEGIIKAAEIVYLFDGGAYSDKAIDVSRAGGVDCTGPYHIENVWCNSYCIYTNHPYGSPFRGFGHSEVLFAFERTMDKLSRKLGMDPIELRKKNAILPGHTTPTQVVLNRSNVGNLPACIDRLKELINWNQGQIEEVNERKIRVKGIACSWKTSTIDPDASSGVILTFNPDGSINLMSGVVEIGTGTKTVLAQILAERLKLSIDKIHVRMQIDTQTTPEHWKTVASRGTFMGGRAVLEAAEDVIRQIKNIATCVLRVSTEDLEVADGKVFLRDNPKVSLDFKEVVYGYKFPNGNTIGGQIIGHGNYVIRRITKLDPNTGAGQPGPEWTVAAHAVEVEYDKRDFTYQLKKAVTVVDIGTVLNHKAAVGQVMGAMSMGLAYAGRETFIFDHLGRITNPQLRTYRPIHYGENPDYLVDFVTTPQIDAPYGARGVGEHGLLGMPAALANSLTLAAGAELNELPVTPELIWRCKGGGDLISYDFEYHNPKTYQEAVSLFNESDKDGKSPMYYSGGTEIITLGKLNIVRTGSVIDINNILECNVHELNEEFLVLGAALTLTTIEEKNLFPLLSQTVSEIADRTSRNKITVGGNICGQIFLSGGGIAFLLTDSILIIASNQGIKSVPITEIFNEQLRLKRGEFLMQIKTNRKFLEVPFFTLKRRRQWNTGYPLLTVAALKFKQGIRVAISGLSPFPFRSYQIEDALNKTELSYKERIELAINSLNVPILNDTEGTSRYRIFVLKNILYDVLQTLGGENSEDI